MTGTAKIAPITARERALAAARAHAVRAAVIGSAEDRAEFMRLNRLIGMAAKRWGFSLAEILECRVVSMEQSDAVPRVRGRVAANRRDRHAADWRLPLRRARTASRVD